MEETTYTGFYKDDFDIDEFLNKQTETNELKEILHSLNEMKNINSNQMTTVLREKTDAVILIAEQLQSLYKKIDNLQTPLSQLKEEIKILVKRVNDVVHLYDSSAMCLKNSHTSKIHLTAIRAYKLVLLHTHQFIKSFIQQDDIDFEGLERLICKYASHAFILQNLDIKDTEAIRPSVDTSVRIILRDVFLKAYKSNNLGRITRLIDMYVYMDMLDAFKQLVRDDIVKPKVEPILCDENLRACGDDMSLLYAQALAVLEHDLQPIIIIIRNENIEVDIVLDCYWNVVDKLLRTNLLTITAAGHPDAFFKHFQHTHRYLQDIGRIYGDDYLYKHNLNFIEHLKRFNLLVYYEIRHQYVSSSFEHVILKSSEFTDANELEKMTTFSKTNGNGLQLKVSVALEVLIEYLFSDKVFIAMISEQFMKSALLLSARYITWVRECLLTALKRYTKSHQIVVIAVRLINDIKHLAGNLPMDDRALDGAINVTLRGSIQEQLRLDFDTLYKETSHFLVNYHLEEMRADLRNVSDIPRLYRKTNRSVPQNCSSYVKDAFDEVEQLSKMTVASDKDKLFVEEHKFLLNELLRNATNEYNGMVHSVLNAVFKTEESLKRLKSRNVVSNDGGVVSQGSSDEAKIRLQIKLDVQRFVENVRMFKLPELESELAILLQQIENF